MKKTQIIILYILTVLLTGCIHQYPGEVEDTTQVNVAIDVEIDSSLPVYQGISRATDTGQKRRFIIDVYQDGKVIAEKRILTTKAEQTGQGRYSIPLPMKLHAREYTFVVWNDYVEEDTGSDLHFNAADLTNVSLNELYHPDYRQREAFCGVAQADFTSYKDEESAQVRQHIFLKRPQAKFRIISADTEEFITRAHTRRDRESDYRVTLGYEYFLPTAYDVAGGVLCDSKPGVRFTAPCNIEADAEGKCELASDFVFVGTDASHVTVTLEVTDGEGKVISRVTGVKVPVKQGHLTTVTGNFLTTLMQPGVSIDPGYEGEFDITIP